jgi:hypothetical protein
VAVGRRWGSTTATPDEIARVSEALRDSRAFETDPALNGTPEMQGIFIVVRMAFLIRPELADLDGASDAAATFWREVLGADYRTLKFGGMVEAALWLRGFTEGAVDGYMGLEA